MTAPLLRAAAPLVLGTLLTACSRAPENPATPASAEPAPAAAAGQPDATATPVLSEGAPRIADSLFDGVHIQYRVYGSGEPLVVLIHGWSCDSNYWAAQLDALKAKYTVVTVDLAGHGGSGANRSQWSMGAFGDDVAAVVKALPQHPRVILVGHSMGGPVAVEAAARLADRVIGVIGVDTYKGLAATPLPPAEIEKRMQAMEADFIGSVRALVTNSFFTKDADPAFVRRIADDMASAPPSVGIPAVRALNAWTGETAQRAFASVQVPVIAINSDLGGVTDEARIRKIAPTFRLVTMPGTGHFLQMEVPDRFNPVLEEQIQSLLTAPRTAGT